MKPTEHPTLISNISEAIGKNSGRRAKARPCSWLLPLLLSIGAASLSAQTATTGTSTSASNQTATTSEQQVVQLSPFVVTTSKDTGYLSEQTLAGSRSAANLQDLSASVTIINQQLASDLNAADVTHLVSYGVSGVTNNQYLYDDFIIRGFRVDNSMRDGITQQNYAPNPMYDVERIEVIKGPTAMVMGDNVNMGGAVNFIPYAPTATATGNMTMTVNTDDIGKTWYRLAANASGPLYQSKDLTALYRVTIGGTDGESDKDFEGHSQKFVGGALTMFFHENKDTSLSIDWYTYNNDDQWNYDDFLDNRSPTVAKLNPYSTRTFSMGAYADAPQHQNQTLVDVTFLTKCSENANLRLFYSYSDFTYFDSDLTGHKLEADNYTMIRALTPYQELDSNTALQADYLYKRSFFDMFTNSFTAGADYRIYRSGAGETFFTNLAPVDTRNPHPDYSGDAAIVAADLAVPFNTYYDTLEYLYTLSYYLREDVSFFHDRVILTGALRWFDSRSTNQDFVANTLSETDNAPFQAHNFGIVVKPLSWISLYFNSATTQIPLAGFTNPPSGPPQPFVPEGGKNNEIGLKVDYKLSEKLSVRGSIDHFSIQETNVYTTALNGQVNAQNGLPVITQSAENVSAGWELDCAGRFSFDSGNADLIVTAYRADTTSAATKGGQAPGVSDETFSVLGKYTFKKGLLKGAMFGGGGHSEGRKYELPYVIYTPNLYNCFASYPVTKNWSMQVNWDNMTNKRYLTTVANSAEVMPGEPGQVSVIATFHW